MEACTKNSTWMMVVGCVTVSFAIACGGSPGDEGDGTGNTRQASTESGKAGGGTGTPKPGGDTGTPKPGGDTGTPKPGGDTGAPKAGGDTGSGGTSGRAIYDLLP
jgi:hypothetical protein